MSFAASPEAGSATGLAAPDNDAAIRVLHVIAGLDPAHGGPSYSAPRLCAELAGMGAQVGLFTVDSDSGQSAVVGPTPYELRSFPRSLAKLPVARSLRLSGQLAAALGPAAGAAEVVHNHGIWLAPNLAAQRAAAAAGAPFVCSIRGMLSSEALAFSAGRKALVWRLGQRAALQAAACLHATSLAEYADIRARGLRSPVAIVPNGIDIPVLGEGGGREAPRTLLSLGRIHPKKGLDTLLGAWRRVQEAHPDWRLRIIGPSEDGYDRELLAQAGAIGCARVSIEGPAYGPAKAAAFEEAALFAMPTRNENFGLTVAEALAAGVPVVCAKGAPWERLTTEGCGWWGAQDTESLAGALGEAMARPPDTLASMGLRGRGWMAREFSWAGVATDMLRLYAWLARGAERPPFVRLD